MVKDMTQGSPFKLIISFALPLMIGHVFQSLYNTVDTIIVGKCIGVDALAAVGSTSPLSNLILGLILGICGGFTIPIAQFFGAGDLHQMRKYVANAIYLGIFITFLFTAATMLFTPSHFSSSLSTLLLLCDSSHTGVRSNFTFPVPMCTLDASEREKVGKELG